MKKRFKFDWKKNYRKTPDGILKKVESLSGDNLSVACVKKISALEISANRYFHLGISLEDGKPVFKEKMLPDPRVGRYSSINRTGLVLIRQDLPMTTKTFTFDAPNYGDWSNGSHEVEWNREVYRRDFIGPKELELEIELLDEEIKEDRKLFVFKFRVAEVLNRTEKKFKDDLLFNLNLLQENVGAANVFASDATRAEYLKTVFVDWEILPPGKRDETIERILSSFKSADPTLKKKLQSRYDLLIKLKPTAFINGTSGFRRYFGAQFTDKLVAFENIEYGNAMYVMYEQWEALSKKSRMELLSSNRRGFDRIIHTGGWEGKLERIIKESENRS